MTRAAPPAEELAKILQSPSASADAEGNACEALMEMGFQTRPVVTGDFVHTNDQLAQLVFEAALGGETVLGAAVAGTDRRGAKVHLVCGDPEGVRGAMPRWVEELYLQQQASVGVQPRPSGLMVAAMTNPAEALKQLMPEANRRTAGAPAAENIAIVKEVPYRRGAMNAERPGAVARRSASWGGRPLSQRRSSRWLTS